MKQLDILAIASQIGGQITHKGGLCATGGPFYVDNVVTKLHQLGIYAVKNNTLFFDLLERPKDIKNYRNYRNCVAVTSQPQKLAELGPNWTIIKVPSATVAYWDFISYYRNLFPIPVVGVTGTCGKSSVKEMIKFILSKSHKVQATKLSENSLYLNKHYLFGIDDNTEAAVLEMGVERPGDIANSCRYFSPNIGIITTIGVDHLQGCGTLEGYIRAKSELLEGMCSNGTLILNIDDKNIDKIDLNLFKGRIIYFGCSPKAEFRASAIEYLDQEMAYTLNHHENCYHFCIPGYGEHNVYNAIAAIAAVHATGLISIREAGVALGSFKHLKQHLEIRKGINESVIIDDTWSFNPTSFEAAIKVLKKICNGKRTVLVLGQLVDFINVTKDKHLEIGQIIAEKEIDILVTIGANAREIGEGAEIIGMPAQNIHSFTNSKEAVPLLSTLCDSNTIILVKKSMKDSFGDLIDQITK